jgi:hypothetical protein
VKIVPNNERWNEGERDWSFVPDPKNDIAAWERRTGFHLPDEYRKFLLKFNGGSVYPRLFKHSISPDILPSISPEEFVDRIYRWDQVEALNNGQGYGQGIPPKCLNIAETPGPLEILLSCDESDFGMIYGWIRSSNPWGTGTNKEKYLLAADFSIFLKMLYDDEEKTDYEGWFIPAYTPVIRELEL